MATRVIMPKQGLQMTEGNIMNWLKAEGETVSEGEPLFEMETDKLTIEINAPASGTLLKIVHPAGDVVPITELIAVIGEPGEDITELVQEGNQQADTAPQQATEPAKQGTQSPNPSASASAPRTQHPAQTSRSPHAKAESPAPAGPNPTETGARLFSTPRARLRAEESGVDLQTVQGSGPDGLVIERDVLTAAASAPRATPLAKKVAAQAGVSLQGINGSGPRGRITKRDVEVAASAGPGTAAPSPEQGDRLIPLTGMRKVIARRMRESLDTAAQAVHRIEVDMSEAVRLREKLKELEIAVSHNDIILKAVAAALRKHPRMNSMLTEEGIVEFGAVNIGVAVAVEEGLVVPVMRSVDMLSLTQIHAEARRLVELAREGGLSPDDMTGGTFSVSNLGMFGIDSFTAIIDTPESGILAVGAIKERVVALNGESVIRPMTHLTLTYDHRVIDGAPAAQFLSSVKLVLENPYMLI